MRPVCVIIRDGWGYNENPKGNAVIAARTPNIDSYKEKYPWTLLEAAGEPVGLPDGYQGSSEVGHLNIGAGRIVIQELKRIDDGLRDGSLFEHDKWKNLVRNWKADQGRLHLLGLLQDEGVHAHQEHLFKIMRRAREEYPEGEIIIHPFLDGRDTPPRSCLEFIAKLKKVMTEVGSCRIGTVMGRYYGMDRSRNWELTDIACNCLAFAEGIGVDLSKYLCPHPDRQFRHADDVAFFQIAPPAFEHRDRAVDLFAFGRHNHVRRPAPLAPREIRQAFAVQPRAGGKNYQENYH